MTKRDLFDRIEQRRLMVAIGGGFDVNSRRFNAAFCRCLVMDIQDQPDDVVPFERTVRRIRAMIGRRLRDNIAGQFRDNLRDI